MPSNARRWTANRRRRASAVAVAIAVASLVSTACSPLQDLRFAQDDRLRIEAPEDLAELHLPVVLRWTMTGFTPRPPGSEPEKDSGYFAVFVDRYPMAPGKSLGDALPPGACDGSVTCLPPEDLAGLYNIYVTDGSEVTLRSVPSVAGGLDTHYAVIVLVDGSGRRLGDSFWTVSFLVHEDRSGS